MIYLCPASEARPSLRQMIADTRAELHEAAKTLQLERDWFRDLRTAKFPHYTTRPGQQRAALAAGAVSLTRLECSAKIKELREKGWP